MAIKSDHQAVTDDVTNDSKEVFWWSAVHRPFECLFSSIKLNPRLQQLFRIRGVMVLKRRLKPRNKHLASSCSSVSCVAKHAANTSGEVR